MKYWFVYIVKCADDTLYTGVTTNLDRRVAEHNLGKLGAKYTKARRPVVLAYARSHKNRSAAQKAEAQIKRLKLVDKLKLIHKDSI